METLIGDDECESQKEKFTDDVVLRGQTSEMNEEENDGQRSNVDDCLNRCRQGEAERFLSGDKTDRAENVLLSEIMSKGTEITDETREEKGNDRFQRIDRLTKEWRSAQPMRMEVHFGKASQQSTDEHHQTTIGRLPK